MKIALCSAILATMVLTASCPPAHAQNTIHPAQHPVKVKEIPPAPALAVPRKALPVTTPGDAPVPSAGNEDPTYTINPGDVLQVTVWHEDGLDREAVVLPDGTIDFPLIGSVNVKGMTPTDAQNVIKAKIVRYIPEASVAVVIKAPLGHSVNVIGQVTKPGEVIMARRMTVMQALSAAGGLTPYADEGDIKILRHADKGEISIEFPYDDVADGDNLDKDIVLMPGDVVVVPTASLF